MTTEQAEHRAISWRSTKSEAKLIGITVDRAERIAAKLGVKFSACEMIMDLTACNANGCRLDFAKLLAFPDADFAHDVFGVRRYIDRETGRITGHFLPRCHKATRLPAPAIRGGV